MKIEFTTDKLTGNIDATVSFDEDTVSRLYRSWDVPSWWLVLSDDMEVSIARDSPLAQALDTALAEEATAWVPTL
jgi:hypothetical protein